MARRIENENRARAILVASVAAATVVFAVIGFWLQRELSAPQSHAYTPQYEMNAYRR